MKIQIVRVIFEVVEMDNDCMHDALQLAEQSQPTGTPYHVEYRNPEDPMVTLIYPPNYRG